MISRRIAVLQDSPDFGGHERLFLEWLPGLLTSTDVAQVHVRCPEQNTRFIAELGALEHAKLKLQPGPHAKRRSEPFMAPLRVAYGRETRRFVRACGADLVLLLQGRIENLATPLLWLPRDLDIVNYLPMAHTGPEMGRPAVISAFTDGVKRLYYARPNRTIVVSQAVATQARHAGAKGLVHVVENVPPGPPPGPRPVDMEKARQALGLPREKRIALFMGRFDGHQKGLDRLLRDLEAAGPRLGDWHIVFVGQGPAEPAIRRLLDRRVFAGDIVGWTNQPNAYLQVSDVLLLPSRFEGVPLVMLEAIQEGLPILASDIDVFREYLPSIAIRDFKQAVDIVSALDDLTEPGALRQFQAHARSIRSRLNAEHSRQRFAAAVLGHAMPDAPAAAPTEPWAS